MTREELELRIKTLEKDAKILKRLYFVKFRYAGESVRSLQKELELLGMKPTFRTCPHGFKEINYLELYLSTEILFLWRKFIHSRHRISHPGK